MSNGCGAFIFWILNSYLKIETQSLATFPRSKEETQGLENLESSPKLRVTSRTLKKRNLTPHFRRQINLWTTIHSHYSRAGVPVTLTPQSFPHTTCSGLCQQTNGASYNSLSCLCAFVCLLLAIPSIHCCLPGENVLILKCPFSSDSFWLAQIFVPTLYLQLKLIFMHLSTARSFWSLHFYKPNNSKLNKFVCT